MRTESALLMVFSLGTALPAHADDCVDKLTPEAKYAVVIGCLKDRLGAVSVLESRVRAAEARLAGLATPTIHSEYGGAIGVTHRNDTDSIRIVIISAVRNTEGPPAYSMCGNVARDSSLLPLQAGQAPCNNRTTQVVTSFAGKAPNASMSFIVPSWIVL